MKKSAFTLAEILISLMILGVIASLTIPSLIQNTQKKEQVVQIKKGLSMINQAISMNYALTSEDLSDIKGGSATSTPTIQDLFKKRLSVVAGGGSSDSYVRTQDGLTYYWQASTTHNTECGVTGAEVGEGTNATGNCYDIIISTKSDAVDSYDAATTDANNSQLGRLTGYYRFYAGADRVVPSNNTQAIMNATDATKVDSGS